MDNSVLKNCDEKVTFYSIFHFPGQVKEKDVRSRSGAILSVSAGKDQAGSDKDQTDAAEDQPDIERCVGEKRLRHDIDQKIRTRIKNPQIIVKENMMKHNEAAGKI